MWTISRARRVLPAALLAAGVLVSVPACSAGIYTTTRSSYGDVTRRAYDTGYQHGFEDGRNDARRQRSFSLDRHGEYRDAQQGYRGGDGERDPYRVAFRRGFEGGYRDAFNRYGNYERRR